MEYVIYADESAQEGKYYSYFYGGALVRSTDLGKVQNALVEKKAALKFGAETKWSKVTSQYLDRYLQLMDCFFDLVEADSIKVRIMFCQNANVPVKLSKEHIENRYFLLYYQFIKHAFGLTYAGGENAISCRVYLDKMPDTRERVEGFKGYLCGLTLWPGFRNAGIRFQNDQIAEVCSHDHVVLQCLDIVLGSMQFRLNDGHKAIPSGAKRRGKRTIAKEKLQRHISGRIRRIYPNFNIGISTGTRGNLANRWKDPYRHWLFVPADSERDATRTK